MAKPIKETPVLRGKDAAKFLQVMEIPKVPMDKETRERIKSNFSKLNSIAKF